EEILHEILADAFPTGGVRRLTASVTAGNEASKQLLLKAGFRLEGELRENYWLNGRWHNDWLFGRLRGEGDAP
ncbi:TPA: GNAT family N-acetyltransferase, partial [Klebsiella pneumoniae]|nr:GNAT family N-acetyltransferase [Klebsiella pneumoniae]